MYYTTENEWIEYHGHNAFVGICKIKLSGTNAIQGATFCNVSSSLEKGDVIATFYHDHSAVEVYMPVGGKIVDINKKLLDNPSQILSTSSESTWIVKISPDAPYKREGLLQLHQYRALTKKGQGSIHG